MLDIVYGKKNVSGRVINQRCCIELTSNFMKLFDIGLIIIRDIDAKQLLF